MFGCVGRMREERMVKRIKEEKKERKDTEKMQRRSERIIEGEGSE